MDIVLLDLQTKIMVQCCNFMPENLDIVSFNAFIDHTDAGHGTIIDGTEST